jgi:tetratricopeptide (TPR) repeat protein
MNPKFGEKVAVEYQIFCFDEKNEIQIENTKDESSLPFIFEISKSTLPIQFFSEQVLTMSPKESKTIITAVQNLYGIYGHPLLGLHPSAPLKIQLTLLEIFPANPPVTDPTLYDRALKCKEEGNSFVSQQKYEEAKKCYLNGVSLYIDVLDSDATPSSEAVSLLVQMFNNMALCEHKLKNYNSVMNLCAIVIDLAPKDEAALAKAHFRFGWALEVLRNDHVKSKGSKADKDWCTKEARYHYTLSNTYSKGADQNVKKKLQTMNAVISAPKGFAGMFQRDDNSSRGLTKF